MYKILFLFIFACWSVEASQYPIIYNIKTSDCADCTSLSATFQQKLVEMGGMVDQIVDSGHRWVTIGTKQTKVNSQGVGTDYFYPINIGSRIYADVDDTYAEAAVKYYNTPGAQWNIAGVPRNAYASCITYVFLSKTDGEVPWANVISPGGCVPIPPSYEWCELNMPTILIDHGTMGMGASDGNSATQNIGVDCVAPTAVSFSLMQQGNYIDLEPSGRAEIEVDNKALGTAIDLPEGSSTLSIKSTLSGITTEGVNTGSSVLTMMPY